MLNLRTEGVFSTAFVKQIHLKNIHSAGASPLTNNNLQRNFKDHVIKIFLIPNGHKTDVNSLFLNLSHLFNILPHLSWVQLLVFHFWRNIFPHNA